MRAKRSEAMRGRPWEVGRRARRSDARPPRRERERAGSPHPIPIPVRGPPAHRDGGKQFPGIGVPPEKPRPPLVPCTDATGTPARKPRFPRHGGYGCSTSSVVSQIDVRKLRPPPVASTGRPLQRRSPEKLQAVLRLPAAPDAFVVTHSSQRPDASQFARRLLLGCMSGGRRPSLRSDADCLLMLPEPGGRSTRHEPPSAAGRRALRPAAPGQDRSLWRRLDPRRSIPSPDARENVPSLPPSLSLSTPDSRSDRPQFNHCGRNSITNPSRAMAVPLISFSQRPWRSCIFRRPRVTTTSITITASSSM